MLRGVRGTIGLLVLEHRLTGQMAQIESRLTWRMIAVIAFFATAATILNAFVA